MDIFSVLNFLQKLVHTDLFFDLVYEIDWIKDAYIVWGARLLDLRVYHWLEKCWWIKHTDNEIGVEYLTFQ